MAKIDAELDGPPQRPQRLHAERFPEPSKLGPFDPQVSFRRRLGGLRLGGGQRAVEVKLAAQRVALEAVVDLAFAVGDAAAQTLGGNALDAKFRSLQVELG